MAPWYTLANLELYADTDRWTFKNTDEISPASWVRWVPWLPLFQRACPNYCTLAFQMTLFSHSRWARKRKSYSPDTPDTKSLCRIYGPITKRANARRVEVPAHFAERGFCVKSGKSLLIHFRLPPCISILTLTIVMWRHFGSEDGNSSVTSTRTKNLSLTSACDS